ncbi:unnamed protein product [Ceutorhynchus assimilis]|uniref:Large ribosomal subunit protein mL44 n=1 Tax=Ceutorhynchus assimilis TaxID=467358 RepID=A0A9N9QLH2_9CUCU|nr:unnamed protein product [Ceutorhynchus assimilis]
MSLWRYSLRLSKRILCNHSTAQILKTEPKNIHRWVAPTMRVLARRRKELGPEPEKPRSSHLEWNYDVEINCFCKRLGEKFDVGILKTAFVQREWANLQEFKTEETGEESSQPIPNNFELAHEGFKLIYNTIKEVYSKSYPQDIVNAVCNYLTTDEMLANIAKHLGVNDLIISAEFPPETKTTADTFKAIVAALSKSVDESRVKLFINDFVICQMVDKDISDVWTPEKPYDYLLNILQGQGVQEVEPRLCNKSAVNTILANYQVGLYNGKDKSCLGLGWGENIQIAKDMAALDALQRIYKSNVRK